MKTFLFYIATSPWVAIIIKSILVFILIVLLNHLIVLNRYNESSKTYEKLKIKHGLSILSNDHKNFDDYIQNRGFRLVSILNLISLVVIIGTLVTVKSTTRTEIQEVRSTSYKIGFEEGDYFVFNQTNSIGVFNLIFNSTKYANFYVFKIDDSELFNRKLKHGSGDLWTHYSDNDKIYELVEKVSNSYSSLNAHEKNVHVNVDHDELKNFLEEFYSYSNYTKLSKLKQLMSDERVELVVDIKHSTISTTSILPILKGKSSTVDNYAIKYRVVNKNQTSTDKSKKKSSILDVD